MSELKRIVLLLKDYILKYIGRILLNIVLSAVAGIVIVSPLGLINRLFDSGISGKSEKDVLYAALSMIMLAIVGALLVYVSTVISGSISTSIYKNVVDNLYMKIQSLDLKFFSEIKVGELMVRFTNDAASINNIIINIFNIVSYFMQAVVALGLAIYIDWKLTLSVIVIAPILIGVVKRYTKKLKNIGKKRQEASGEMNSSLQESISGIKIIKAFANENYEVSKFKVLSSKVKLHTLRGIRYDAKSNSISEALNYVIMALLLLFGGFRVIRGNGFTTGDFITIAGAISVMYTPIKRCIGALNNIASNTAALERVFEILSMKAEIVDSKTSVEFTEFNDNIEFENVTFSYDGTKNVLNDINIKITKGEKVALVGNSGGGKTTIANLIPRFYDTNEGSIKIDGINVKNYKLKSLRRNIGIVPQETFLFSGTIKENIKYGNRKASDEEVIKAAKMANAHEFIEKLSDGYDTEIGERGILLSGGQKQRVAIARAILEDPKILILDEATSALDNESEKLVQDALETLMEEKTTLVIAHRLTTIVNSDRIIVLQNGEIAESGTHQELMEKNGIYRSLYERNFED